MKRIFIFLFFTSFIISFPNLVVKRVDASITNRPLLQSDGILLLSYSCTETYSSIVISSEGRLSHHSSSSSFSTL